MTKCLWVIKKIWQTWLDIALQSRLYIFERLKFVVFKIDKTETKNLNEEEHGQSKNEDFEAFKRVILLLL